MELREKWRKSINEVDEKFLKMIDSLYSSYMEDSQEYEISDEHKKLLDERLADYEANPDSSIEWEVVREEIKTKYGF